ncbi:MAG: hypothetical protein AB9880_12535 [Christensenellales bacterium]
MQAIFETIFDIIYLTTVISLGIIMIRRGGRVRQYLLFGIMAVTLGAGDAFHLVPRAYALLTSGLQDFTVALGIGKLITSVTMTFFYVLLYHVWRARYRIVKQNGLTAAVYLPAAVRILLIMFPQNAWTSADAPLDWAIWRNIPFAALGLLVILLFGRNAKAQGDHAFRHMGLTIVLSFAFYVPVVLFADTVPWTGILMVPKTLAYIWTVWIGFSDMTRSLAASGEAETPSKPRSADCTAR